MNLTLVLLAVVVVLVVGAAAIAFLGYGPRDLLYLCCAVLPMVWLSRLHLYEITIAESSFVLLWAAFAGVFVLGVFLGVGRTKLAIRSSARPAAAAMWILVGWMGLTNLAQSRETADVVRGINAVLFVVLPFLAARGTVYLCKADPAGVRRAVLSLHMAGIALSTMSVLSVVLGDFFRVSGIGVTYQTYGYSRAYSPLGGANGTGMILTVFYSLAFAQLLAKRHRLIATVAMTLSFGGLLATLARGAMVGFVVANAYLLVSSRRGLARRSLIAVGVGLFLLFPLAYKLNQVYTLERLDPTAGDIMSGGSVTDRMETMKASLGYAAQHPVLGGGWGLVYDKPRIRYSYDPGSRERSFYLDGRVSLTTPHSLPALVLVETGLLGLILLGLLVRLMWRALALPDATVAPEGAALVQGFRAGVLSFLVVSLVQDNLFLADRVAYCFYIIFFTGLAVSAAYRSAGVRPDLQPLPAEQAGFVRPSPVGRGPRTEVRSSKCKVQSSKDERRG